MYRNQKLFELLDKVFGEVHISNESSPGKLIMPKAESSFNMKALKGAYLQVADGGEQYQVCCPVCGDTKFHLYFTHFFGANVTSEGKSVGVVSTRWYHCHRRHCVLPDDLISKLNEAKNFTVEIDKKTQATGRNPLFKIIEPVLPPVPNYSLLAEETPQAVRDYVQKVRGFDIEHLTQTYGIRYVPREAAYRYKGAEDKEIVKPVYVPRLLIPIIRGSRFVGWQGRALREGDEPKYFTRAPKGSILYNMDNASRENNIVIVEGVTDVWRIGNRGVALFGHKATASQIEIMKYFWGHCGRAIIWLDEDAKESADELMYTLLNQQIFKFGVSRITTPKDPSDYTEDQVNLWLDSTFNKMEAQFTSV